MQVGLLDKAPHVHCLQDWGEGVLRRVLGEGDFDKGSSVVEVGAWIGSMHHPKPSSWRHRRVSGSNGKSPSMAT
jgi:hypothetical protein